MRCAAFGEIPAAAVRNAAASPIIPPDIGGRPPDIGGNIAGSHGNAANISTNPGGSLTLSARMDVNIGGINGEIGGINEKGAGKDGRTGGIDGRIAGINGGPEDFPKIADNKGITVEEEKQTMPDYLPTKELELQAWAGNFLSVASANLAALGLAQTDLAPVGADYEGFSDALAGVTTAKAAFESAVKTKDARVRSLDRDVRAVVKRIQNHPGVSDALKAQLGVNVPSGSRTKTAPVTPATLTATPKATGVNIVTWDKMGNKPSTQFLVYAKPIIGASVSLGDAGWTFVGQTTRSKFDHSGVVVGQPMAYRVMAARANQASAPSLPATVYAG